MRLAVIALFSILVLALIGAAVRQYSPVTPDAAAPVQQSWLEQKLDAIAVPAGPPPAAAAPGPAPVSSSAALGTAAGGLIGYAIRGGPVGIAVGALVGYVSASGMVTTLFSPPPPKPEPSWWQKVLPPSGT
ncbi:MAG: hypothetical protein WCJ64_27975 [Rhodospirillaceae bacterium]